MTGKTDTKRNPNEMATIHLFYLGGLLVEAFNNLHKDVLANCPNASEILTLSSYMRVVELKDKFEDSALLMEE